MNIPHSRPAMLLRILLVLVVLAGTVALTACDDTDWELLSSWGEDWATSNGVWDGDNVNMGNLVRLGAEQQVDAIFNGPDPALEAGTVAQDIQRADDLAQQAAIASQLDHPDQALRALNTAVQLRPKDFTYVQQRAATSLANGDTTGYEDDLASATRLMERQVQDAQGLEACRRIYREFYQHQLDVLDQAYGMACTNQQCDYITDQQQYYAAGLANADSSPCS